MIEGTTSGVLYEWQLHNIAYWLGFARGSSQSVDLGGTIFDDLSSHPLHGVNGDVSITGIVSRAMAITYVAFFDPISGIIDLIVGG